MHMPGYDSWKLATPPEYDDAYFGLEPQDEDEGEPVITEEPGVTTVTLPNSKQYRITEITAGAFVGDYQIAGPGFYSDGHPSMDAAVSYLLKQEWQSL